MKTIGLLGGMSWESSVLYYQLINRNIKQELGGLHSAKILLNSLDFEVIAQLQKEDKWRQAGKILSHAAQSLEKAGADFVLICTNTMHKVADEIQASISIPLIHIADATADVICAKQMDTVGMLGTAFTMEQEFFKEKISERGVNVLVPDTVDRKFVHHVIFDELCLGKIEDRSRIRFLEMMESLKLQGAQGIILGCTEITMLVNSAHTTIPLFDTTHIHAHKAVVLALS